MDNGEIIDILKRIVGSENVTTAEHIMDCYSVGYSIPSFAMYNRRPLAVVMPTTTEQVSRIMSSANRARVPVTVLAGNTTNEGGGSVSEGGIGMDLSFMDEILEINEEKMYARVQGGCSAFRLIQELDKSGLRLPICPGFGCGPTVGAWVATGGMGFGSAKYGRIQDFLLGLEFVLPTGEIIKTGTAANPYGPGPLEKVHFGPNLAALFPGSGGSLGVMTEVQFRILRQPAVYGDVLYGWPSEKGDEVTKAAFELQQRMIMNLDIRDLDPFGLDPNFVKAIPEGLHFLIHVIEEAQSDEEMDARKKMIKQICEKYGGTAIPDAPTHGYITGISLGGFNSAPMLPGVISFGPAWYHHPLEFMESYNFGQSLRNKYGFTISMPWYEWGILNNSQLSMLWIFSDIREPDHIETGKKLMVELAEGVVKRGWAPHSLGRLWPREALELMGPHYDLLKRIKKLFDPNNILNPGILYI